MIFIKNNEVEYTIINDDCFNVFESIKSNSIPLVVTDIPYGKVNRKSNGLRNLNKGEADIVNFDIKELVDKLCFICSGSIYIFCGTEQVSEIRKYMVENGMSTRLCIWEKSNPSPMNGEYIWLSGIECCVFGKKRGATFNEHCKNTVWKYPCVRGAVHPTQKPVSLIEYIVNTSSNVGDTVFDPFMGSGTTGIACLNSKRKFLGIEKNKEFFDIAYNRISKYKIEGCNNDKKTNATRRFNATC